MCPGATRENLTLLVDGAGKEYKINRDGFRAGREHIRRLAGLIEERTRGGGVAAIFSGSMPPGIDSDCYAGLMLAARREGSLLAIDTEALSAERLAELSPWLCKPNGDELCGLFGIERTDDEQTLTECAIRLGKQGVDNVLLTMGERGLALISGRGFDVERIYASDRRLTDTTGAGDRALAGFVAAYCRGMSRRECAAEAARFAEMVSADGA